jgi:hypothetical protein
MLEETLYIEKNKPLTQAEDYLFLREKGMEYLQALSGKLWTDYNLHDPGVTILELLCYAITDIGYRSNFSMADLLTKAGKTKPDKTNSFFTAKEILTTHPITVEDYRRLLIDRIPGLKNIWLEEIDNADNAPAATNEADTTYFKPRTEGYAVKLDEDSHSFQFVEEQLARSEKKLHIHGLYRVKIELDDWETILADAPLKAEIQKALNKVRPRGSKRIILRTYGLANTRKLYEKLVKRTLHFFRNLCEDFEAISVMKDEQVTICADIEVIPNTDINELLKKIYRLVYNYASPSLNFYSMQEMLDKGKSIEEIYEGVVPKKGFVDLDELKTRFGKQRLVIYTSDLINLIMNLDGVIAVKKLLLSSSDEAGKTINDGEKYCLHLSDTENLSFRFKHLSKTGKSLNKIIFYKSNLPFKAQEPDAKFVMRERKEPIAFVDDLPIPNGTFRGLDKYVSVQNEFPQVYYSGLDKMPQSENTVQRQAQRMQLKGYLIFFEQLLANYLANLNNVASLYSWNNPTNTNTYKFQKLQDITATGESLIDFTGIESASSDYLAVLNDPENNLARKNKLLDSLLARFNEKFADYGLFRYTHSSESLSFNDQEEKIKDKASFLKNYALVSANRSHAINISLEAWASRTRNIAGFQRYLTAILGLNVYQDHYLAKVVRKPKTGEEVLDKFGQPTYYDIRKISFNLGFGLHMIEHILLRPLAVNTIDDPNEIEFLSMCCCDDDKEPTANDYCADPYSMRMTVVLPGWLNVSMDMDFRKFVNNTLRANAPTHVALKICWIGMVQMYEYEKTYVAFLKVLKQRENMVFTNGIVNDAGPYNYALSNFVHVINNLKNVYPPATLHDCENSERDPSGNLASRTVILNRTTLGDSWPKGINIIPYKSPFTPADPVPPAPPVIPEIGFAKLATRKISVSKKTAIKKSDKKVVAKKAIAKKAAPKKVAAKKVAAKKVAVKKVVAKKAVIKKKAITKKVTIEKAAPKKAITKQAISKKIVPKKSIAKKVAKTNKK